MSRCLPPPLDDWEDGKPDGWDYDAVLKENGVTVEWCDELIDGNGNRHPAGDLAGWGFSWKHGAIHVGPTTEVTARKAAAMFVSLWLRGVSASFCDKITSGMVWFWELRERPERSNSPTPLDLARRFHETYERLAPSYGYMTRPDTRQFNPDSPNGRLMIAVCEEVLTHSSTRTVTMPSRSPLSPPRSMASQYSLARVVAARRFWARVTSDRL